MKGQGCSLGASLFIGIILIAVAAGSIFPRMNWTVAGKLVCGRGILEGPDVQTFSYKPGSVDMTTTYYCFTQGEQRDITLLTVLVAGLIYSASLYLITLVIGLVWKGNPLAAGQTAGQTSNPPASSSPQGQEEDLSTERRKKLKELRDLHDSNLINEQEYEQKKKAILEEM